MPFQKHSLNFLLYNSNGGQMIKFQLFDSENSYQCHFSEIATFVVSIAHYMRAYFNYQAILRGTDFELPGDAAYLCKYFTNIYPTILSWNECSVKNSLIMYFL